MSKTKVSFKLNNLEQKVKKIVNELKKEKFAETIKDTIVGAIREDSLNPKTGKKFKSLSSPFFSDSTADLSKEL